MKPQTILVLRHFQSREIARVLLLTHSEAREESGLTFYWDSEGWWIDDHDDLWREMERTCVEKGD
jgi:hypothetical protein